MCIRDRAEAVGRLPAWIHFEDLKEKIPELVTPAMTYLRATGRMLLHVPVSYTHLRAHETVLDIVCRLLLEKKQKNQTTKQTS